MLISLQTFLKVFRTSNDQNSSSSVSFSGPYQFYHLGILLVVVVVLLMVLFIYLFICFMWYVLCWFSKLLKGLNQTRIPKLLLGRHLMFSQLDSSGSFFCLGVEALMPKLFVLPLLVWNLVSLDYQGDDKKHCIVEYEGFKMQRWASWS